MQGWLARGLVERGEREGGRMGGRDTGEERDGLPSSRDSPRFGVVSEMPRSGQIGEGQAIH